MSTSLLNLDQAAPRAEASAIAPPMPAQRTLPEASLKTEDRPAPAASSEVVDFEIVLGRRQLASTSLMLVVGLVCFSGVSYLIGRSSGTKTSASSASDSAPVIQPVSRPVVPSPAVAKVSMPPMPVALPPVSALRDQSPIFGEELPGQVYLQVGAIDKGLAGVWAEGLRAHGLKAFAAPSPVDKFWRVVIGPLPDPNAFQQAKNVLAQLGVDTFGRRFENTPVATKSAPAPSAPVQAAANPAPAN